MSGSPATATSSRPPNPASPKVSTSTSAQVVDENYARRWTMRRNILKAFLARNQTMPERSDPRAEDILSRHEFELARVKEALALLGVSPCSWCEKFFRRS